MWQAIGQVTSGLTLIAFIVAAVVAIFRSRLNSKERQLKGASKEDLPGLIQSLNDSFLIPALPYDLKRLPPDQAYSLLLKQIHDRSKRFYVISLVVVLLAFVAAVVAMYAISRSGDQGVAVAQPGTEHSSSPEGVSSPLDIDETTQVVGDYSVAVVTDKQPASDSRSETARGILIADVSEAYIHSGYKVSFFEDWMRYPTFSTASIVNSDIVFRHPDGRIVATSVDPNLMPRVRDNTDELILAADLTSEHITNVSRFYTTYESFLMSLKRLRGAQSGELPSAMMAASSYARLTVDQGHRALCSLGVDPPKVFQQGQRPEPVQKDCD